MGTQLQTDNATRRTFLGGLIAGAALLAAGCAETRARTPGARADASTPRLGIALLGLGEYSSTQLGPALQRTRHCALRGIVTGTPDKIARWQKDYAIADANVYDYATLSRIADNPAIDVVYVVAPTALHAKYAIMAAEAGKHVWCEKPMAMNVEECQRIIDACRKNHVSLSIGYRMQHEPNTRTVMQLARDRPYGAIARVRAVAGDASGAAPGWRMQRAMGGGALYDMGVYSINALRYATGEEPVRVVRARQWSSNPEFAEVDESSEFELEFPSGASGYGKASRADPENVLHVQAAHGWYELAPMQAYRGVSGKTSDGRALDQKIDSQQALQMDEDALAILEGRPALVPGEEGQRDIHILQAILQAAQHGQAVAL